MLTKKQIEFCQAIASGQNGTVAYAIAYKNDNKNTGRAQAAKMLQRPEIVEKIGEFQSFNRKIVEMAQCESIGKAVLPQLLSTAQRMGMLSQIALGTAQVKKIVTCGEKSVVIETWPGFTERIAAIDALNRMDGSSKLNVEEYDTDTVQISDIP